MTATGAGYKRAMTGTNSIILYVLIAIVAIAIVVAIAGAVRRARTDRLRRRFGPEYDRLAGARGDRAATERELAKREARIKTLPLKDLAPEARQRYLDEWQGVQSRFVDEPHEALLQADVLVTGVMRDLGYPIGSFEQRAADLSPDYAGAVQEYRTAHDVSTGAGWESDTEGQRQAMVHYRSVFNELIGSEQRAAS